MTPTRSRRRGAELEDALYRATLAELEAVGYGGLTMEGVAARARTGKAALYRRWPGKQALVLAALEYFLPPPPEPRADRSARANLLALFTAVTRVWAGESGYPGITVFVEALREPSLRALLVDTLVGPRLRAIEAVLRQAEQTGEVAPGSLSPLAPNIGPALIMHLLLTTGKAPTRRDLNHIVDAVLGTG